MKFFKHKILLGFVFAAAVFFLSLSLGGEFLHEHIHHHATHAEYNDCPVYQLTAQWLLAGVVIAFVSPVFFYQTLVSIFDRFPSEAWRFIVNSRAPPSAHV